MAMCGAHAVLSCDSVGGQSAITRGWPEGPDPLCDVLGVILDPAQKRRAARVLPGQPEEVEPGRLSDTALVDDAAGVIEDRGVDPGMVDSEPGGPHDGGDVDLGLIFEPDGRAVGAQRPSVKLDAVLPAQPPRRGSDQRVATGHPTPYPRALCLTDQPRRVEVPEQVASENPLRQWRLPGSNRQVCLPRGGQLLRNLKAGVAAAHHEDTPIGYRQGRPIRRA